MRMNAKRLVKPALFLACLLPAGWLLFALLTDRLGANPIEAVTHETGQWTLRLLLLTLLMTPLRQRFGWSWPIRVRRMLGLFAFFYASLHLLTYLWLDQFFFWGEIVRDVVKRPFITVGMLGFLLLVPLAITSTDGMMRRLGRRWKRLHRLAYLVPVLGVLHYLWLVKADLREPLVYAALLLLLLWQRRPRGRRAPAAQRGAAGT